MRFIFLLLSIASIVSCAAPKPVREVVSGLIEDAYFEKWVSGVPGGDAGINFHVNLKAPLSDDTQLDRVVFKGKKAVFTTQDGLHFSASIITKLGGKTTDEAGEINESLPDSNTAKLYFIIKGETAVHVLENVKEKQMLAYPSMNKPR